MSERSSEIHAIEIAHRAAQARLGIAAAYLAVLEFGAVSATSASSTSGSYRQRVLRMIAVTRRRSLSLSKSYYQLTRALDTGYVLGLPDLEPGSEITLNNLRDHFTSLVEEAAQIGLGEIGGGDADDEWFESNLSQVLDPENSRALRLQQSDLNPVLDELRQKLGSDDPRLRVDQFEWPTETSPERLQKVVDPLVRKHAIDALEAKVADMKAQEYTTKRLEEQARLAHAKAASSAAGVVDWASMQAGRSNIEYAGRRDRRVKAVARGTSGHPCGFCAMLASRGFAYTSAGSAGFGDSGVSKWHPNCHCYPIVRWVANAQLPELNAFFQEQWPKVTKGHSGADARNVWRKWMARRARESNTTTATKSQEG